jgi:transposase-like protein
MVVGDLAIRTVEQAIEALAALEGKHFHLLPRGAHSNRMRCKHCGSESVTKKGFVNKKQLYKCKDCGHRFYENGKFVRMKTDKSLIVTALNLYYDGLSLRKAQRNLEQIFGERISQVTILN